jgi:hypothetical protein
MIPSPLQLRFEVRFTTPLTTCPHAAFVDVDAAPTSAGVPTAGCCCGCCCCCAAAGIAVPIVSVLNVISVINTDAAIMDDILLRLPSSSILNQPESKNLYYIYGCMHSTKSIIDFN